MSDEHLARLISILAEAAKDGGIRAVTGHPDIEEGASTTAKAHDLIVTRTGNDLAVLVACAVHIGGNCGAQDPRTRDQLYRFLVDIMNQSLREAYAYAHLVQGEGTEADPIRARPASEKPVEAPTDTSWMDGLSFDADRKH